MGKIHLSVKKSYKGLIIALPVIFHAPNHGYRAIGEEVYITNEDLNAEILLTLEGDFSKQINDIEITKIELTNLGTIDLGEIVPDLRLRYNQ